MKWLLITVCLTASVFADFNTVKIDTAKEEAAIAAMVKELPAKEKALAAKEYTGTIDVILNTRVADVNELTSFTAEIKVRADAVCEKLDITPKDKASVKAILDREVKKKEAQKRNIEFLEAVHKAVDESMLPIEDPNAAAHNLAMADLWAFCVENVNPY